MEYSRSNLLKEKQNDSPACLPSFQECSGIYPVCESSQPQPSDKISIVANYILLIYKPPMLQLA